MLRVYSMPKVYIPRHIRVAAIPDAHVKQIGTYIGKQKYSKVEADDDFSDSGKGINLYYSEESNDKPLLYIYPHG